jgi:hypothetical protein
MLQLAHLVIGLVPLAPILAGNALYVTQNTNLPVRMLIILDIPINIEKLYPIADAEMAILMKESGLLLFPILSIFVVQHATQIVEPVMDLQILNAQVVKEKIEIVKIISKKNLNSRLLNPIFDNF